MKFVAIFLIIFVVKPIHACNRPATTSDVTKPPGERDWNKWELPPDNEDWEGFVDLLGTREIDMDSSTQKKIGYADEEDLKTEPGFPKRWENIENGYAGQYPPSKSKINGYIGQSAYCLDPPDRGTGKKLWFIRWYYNHTKGRCRRFVYSGFGGNANRFIDSATCMKNCRDPPTPCCVAETLMDFAKYLDPNVRRSSKIRRKRRAKKFVKIIRSIEANSDLINCSFD